MLADESRKQQILRQLQLERQKRKEIIASGQGARTQQSNSYDLGAPTFDNSDL